MFKFDVLVPLETTFRVLQLNNPSPIKVLIREKRRATRKKSFNHSHIHPITLVYAPQTQVSSIKFQIWGCHEGGTFKHERQARDCRLGVHFPPLL